MYSQIKITFIKWKSTAIGNQYNNNIYILQAFTNIREKYLYRNNLHVRKCDVENIC